MADFLTNLWESVFTPGATPTLLVATNVTFGALQLLLLALLVATYSIHFAVLSVLCGGLWWSVNWFATELQAAQKAEADAERLRKKKQAEKDWRAKGEVGDSADDEGEDTEVEGDNRLKESIVESLSDEPISNNLRGEDAKRELVEALTESGKIGGTASGLQATAGASESRQRRADAPEKAPSELSTDSEWEKVEDNR